MISKGESVTVVSVLGRDWQESCHIQKKKVAANTRERQNGQRVVDCRGKGRVATDIATYECSIYRVENEHDVVIGPRLH